VDGSEPLRLTNDPASDFRPTWSPNGKKVAFRTNRHEPNPLTCSHCNDEIYVMNADGTDQTRLTNDPGFDFAPSWSPDGTKMAFGSDRDGDFEVYVMNSDGSSLAKITDNEYSDSSPDWSPDGKTLAFASDRDGDSEIYVMNVDGSGQKPVTENEDNDADPVWRPDAKAAARQ
jgi:Tol biopolymer transport system component